MKPILSPARTALAVASGSPIASSLGFRPIPSAVGNGDEERYGARERVPGPAYSRRRFRPSAPHLDSVERRDLDDHPSALGRLVAKGCRRVVARSRRALPDDYRQRPFACPRCELPARSRISRFARRYVVSGASSSPNSTTRASAVDLRDRAIEERAPVPGTIGDRRLAKTLPGKRQDDVPLDAELACSIEREKVGSAGGGADNGSHVMLVECGDESSADQVTTLERESPLRGVRCIDPTSGQGSDRPSGHGCRVRRAGISSSGSLRLWRSIAKGPNCTGGGSPGPTRSAARGSTPRFAT